MGDLTIIEEVTHSKTNKKQLKTPCRVHGNHEWDECRQNPKNQNSEDKNKNNESNRSRNRNRNVTGNSCNHEEHRCTECQGQRTSRESSREHNRHRSSSRSKRESSDSESDYEYHYISHQNKNDEYKIPSSEILVAMPAKKASKKYTTYLGLNDSGASGSLMNKELIEFADFDVKLQKKPTKWDTANGIMQMDGSVIIENFNLPQFSRKQNITTSLHMYHKKAKDRHDIIIGHDLLAVGFWTGLVVTSPDCSPKH
jgi:hypothetical protein